MEFKIEFEKVDLNWNSLNIKNISCKKSLIFKQYYNSVSKSKNKIDNVKNQKIKKSLLELNKVFKNK